MMIFHGFLQKLHDLGRAFKMAGAANANLNDQHNLYLCQNFFLEEIADGVRGNGMKAIIYRYTHTLLTFAHTEGSPKLNLVAKVVFGDQILKLFYYLTRSFDVAGASDTNCNFHNFIPLTFNKVLI